MSRSRRTSYYGWRIVAVAFLTHCLNVGCVFYSFGVFFTPLIDEFGWSRAQISWGFSSVSIVGALWSPFVGRVVDQYGPRRSQLFGAVVLGATFMLLSTVHSLVQYYLLMALLVSLGSTALSILSHLSVAEFKKAVAAEDSSALAKVKGIGKKISERVILELKDAFPLATGVHVAAHAGAKDPGRVQEDAILALKTLGYTRPGAEAAVRQVWGALDPAHPPSVEELVRKALAVG